MASIRIWALESEVHTGLKTYSKQINPLNVSARYTFNAVFTQKNCQTDSIVTIIRKGETDAKHDKTTH